MPVEHLRLFVALDLPPDVRRTVAGSCDDVPGIGRRHRVPEENLHLTLKFLGNVAEQQRVALVDGLRRQVRFKPFEVRLNAFTCFPNTRRARILAADVLDPTNTLHRLSADIDSTCGAVGFARETQSFRAHVTLARGRPVLPPAAVAAVLHRRAMLRSVRAWTVASFVLMRSTLGGDTPVYEAIERFSPQGEADSPSPK